MNFSAKKKIKLFYFMPWYNNRSSGNTMYGQHADKWQKSEDFDHSLDKLCYIDGA